MEDEKATRIGLKIMELLFLELNSQGRVDTDGGDKTPLGLALTIKRIFEEEEENA